jgi:replicative DNA helicase
MDRSEALLFEIAKRRGEKQAVSIMSVLDQVLAEAERHIQARATGQQIPSAAIPTGFADMDDMFSGGLWPSEVAVVAARPGVGKTTLALNIARRAACRPREKGPIPVAVFNMEMPKEQLAKNILCAEAQINSRRLRNYALDDEEYQKVKLASHNLGNAPIFIDDSPGLTPFELRARGRRLYRAQGVRLIIVDYLQLMQPAGRHDNREQAVADLSRQVKHLARELGIPILLLSQLRRPPPGEEGQRPKLGDLRESGAIEQDADLVVMLHRPLDRETAVMKEEVFAIVQKNRNGPIGQFQLTFFPHQLRFEDFIKEPVDAHSAVGV